MDDIKGLRSGKLVALEPTTERRNNHIVWLCKCDCGNDHHVIASVLKRGLSTSCGCWRREKLTKHGGKGTRLYNIWKGMRQRCRNQNNPKYSRYGERGIDICKEWDDFGVFREWALSNGYKDSLTIDKINNDHGYSPNNCQWLEQSEHSKKSHIDYPNTKKWPSGRARNNKGQFK
jgi:hypothetical protein